MATAPSDGSFSASACPTLDQDVVNGGDAPDAGSDPDGFLNVLEGAPTYGGVQVSLTTEGDTCADSGLAVERSPAGTSIDDSRDIEIPNSGHVQGRLLEGELDLCSEPWSPEG